MPVLAPAEGFAPRITQVLGHFAIGAQPEVAKQLALYCELVVTWNQRVDLTATRTADELVDLRARYDLLMNAFKFDEARAVLNKGIPIALARNDTHAVGEMQELLESLD